MKYEKLSARMASLLNEYRVSGSASMMTTTRAVPLAADHGTAAPKVFVYLRCDENAVIAPLAGVDIHAARGKVRTALVSLDSLDQLSEQDEIYRISPAVRFKPLNDVAATKTNLIAFKNNSGLTGNGVVVGVVDTGIDPNHPAFAGRLHSIWDQDIPGTGWGNTNYGKVLAGATLAVASDFDGHGTHVAGTAAGSDPHFGGVAPNAQMVIVKTDFTNTGIGDGIRYIFAVADALNKPAVVNLSLGGHFDAHDGSDDLSTLIDQESGSGRIVVAAAGNEGNDDIHGMATIPAQQTVDIRFTVPPTSQPGATPWVILNGWYDGNANLEISVRTSSGGSTPFQPIISGAQPAQTYIVNSSRIQVTTPPATSTPNGDHQFLVELTPLLATSAVQGGNWRLRIHNPGATAVRVDVWSLVPQGAHDVLFRAASNSPDMKIGSPGCAAEAITVAAYTTRNAWTDIAGANQSVGLLLDTIADFSSPGPLRNLARKPDVAAPGAMIISCRSSPASPRPTDIISSTFRVDAGTSMAAPYITGLIALLLERDGMLDPAAIKALLQANSSIPNPAGGTFPVGTFNEQWGFGLIDAGNL